MPPDLNLKRFKTLQILLSISTLIGIAITTAFVFYIQRNINDLSILSEKLQLAQTSSDKLLLNREGLLSKALNDSLQTLRGLQSLLIGFVVLLNFLIITFLRLLYRFIQQKLQSIHKNYSSSKEKYNCLFNQTSDLVFYLDKEGKIIDANKQASRSLGYTYKELCKLSIFDIGKSVDLKTFLQLSEQFKKAQSLTQEDIYKHKDGNTFPVEFEISKLDSGEFLATISDLSKHKAVQRRLHESRIELQAIMDHAPNSIFLRDLKGCYLMMNVRALNTLGLSSKEVIGKTPFDLYPKDFAEHILAADQEIVKSRKVVDPFEFVAPFDNKHYLANKFPIFDDKGKVKAIATIATDISERKYAEKALRSSEMELQSLISAMPDLIVVFDSEGNYLRVVSGKRNRFYNTTISRIGKSIYEFASEETADGIVKAIQQTLNTGDIVTHEYMLPIEGQAAWFSAQISLLTSNTVIFVTRSITTYKIAENAIAESEARYRALVENAPEAIVVFNLKTYKIVDLNKNAAHFFGYRRQELLKLTLADISSSPKNKFNPANFKKISKAMDKDKPSLEWAFYTSKGSQIACELRLNYMPSSSSRSLVRCSIVDIRERKQQERALRVYAHYAELNTNVSSMLINLSAQELDSGMKRALAEVGQHIRVEHTLLFLLDKDSTFRCTYEWVKEGFPSLEVQDNLSAISIERIKGGTIVNVPDVAKVRDKYDVDKHFWIEKGLTSFLGLPFSSGKGVTGFLVLASVWEHNWSAQEISALQTIGAIFANTIERQQAEYELAKYQEHLEELVEKRTDELLQALEHLKSTQHELVQSEKMAALGQLVAGIAHEVNTPLGAIRASVGNITQAFKETMQTLPNLLMTLNEIETQLFFDLVTTSLEIGEQLTSREERKLRKKLYQELQDYNIDNADRLADNLVSMGITDITKLSPYMPLLKSEFNQDILQTAFSLASQKRYSETINIATERASKVVFALKQYAHHDYSDEKTLFNVCEGVDMILTLYNNQIKHGVEVVKDYQDVPAILCYPDELNQVWTNLIHNALQAMNYKGKLELGIKQEANNVVISVHDNGKGIPEEIKPHIFEPFFTNKPMGEGSGLGLNIVKKIIEKHSGEISVVSKPNDTTFFVKLPL